MESTLILYPLKIFIGQQYIYIMELKYDKSAQEALDQIKSKDYSLPWSIDARKIIEIGINFSSEKRRIDSWKVREV